MDIIIRLPTTCNCMEAAHQMQRLTDVVDCVAARKMFLPGASASHRLQLNGDKSEITWFVTRANLKNISCQDQSLTIGSDTVQPAGAVRDLGVWLDPELTQRQPVMKIAGACFYHLRRLRHIRRRVGQDVAVRLILALVISRLDYCNSVYAGCHVAEWCPFPHFADHASIMTRAVSSI